MAKAEKSLFRLRRRPRQARAQESVSAILDATAQLLEQDPESSTNHIAERAGVSIGTLYQYFPNRGAIMMMLAEREQERMLLRIRASLAEIDPDQPELALRAALHVFIGAFGRRQRLRRQLILTLLPQAPTLIGTRMLDRMLAESLDHIAARAPARLRRLDAEGRFVLTRAVMGVVRAAIVEERSLEDAALEAEILRLMMAFLRPEGG